jgi:broad specificity phosphatase PhoE
LVDIDYGLWEGLAPPEVATRWPELLAAWYSGAPALQIPGGETLEGVQARSFGVIRDIAARHPGETIGVVGHTIVNRLILLAVLRTPVDRIWLLGQDTCALNVIEAVDQDMVLTVMNDTCHLSDTCR